MSEQRQRLSRVRLDVRILGLVANAIGLAALPLGALVLVALVLFAIFLVESPTGAALGSAPGRATVIGAGRTFVRYGGEGRQPVTDGPFAETKDLIAGWMVIDVETYERAVELAGELSAAPGPDGKPIYEWLEVRPFLTAAPTVAE